ncbi:hypothetical protein N5E31_00740 [Pseudomonas chengduensis]|nr:hypothetical protein [Pseudomonas chengduensis]MDH0621482.1 hypothetical protein [Pseudomonas chengduensis]MDH1664006.1 hypothetical protein [Pseudomonas chengduensis]
MLDKGADNGPFDFPQALCNALPARLVQGLLHALHKHKARVRQSAP